MKKFLFILALFVSIGAADAIPLKPHYKVTTDSVYICQSPSAYAYHDHICRGLDRCTHGIMKVTKAKAIQMGYKPCKICYR